MACGLGWNGAVASPDAGAPAPKAQTATLAISVRPEPGPPLSAEERELAQHLYLLENWELIRDLSMAEVLVLLEDVQE